MDQRLHRLLHLPALWWPQFSASHNIPRSITKFADALFYNRNRLAHLFHPAQITIIAITIFTHRYLKIEFVVTLIRLNAGDPTQNQSLEKLFASINKQLETHNIIVKTGLIIDASVIDTPLRPKGKTNFKVTQDRCEDQVEVHKEYADSVDKEGTWLKKRGKYHFGFKKHHVTDNEGLVLGVLTTTASKNEIANLEEVLETVNVVLPKNIPLKADKGYQSKKNVAILKKRNLKNHLLKKAVKNKPFTKWKTRFNKLIGKTRYKVERTFGGIK